MAGVIAFIVYGILPHSIITFQLCREQECRGKNLQHKNRTSAVFHVLYGWTIDSYKDRAYFWEFFNAAVKVSAVSITELAYNKVDGARAPGHIALFSVSLALHALVRPYKHRSGNVLMVLFCACQIIGASGQNGDDGVLVLQLAYLVLVFATFLLAITIMLHEPCVSLKRKLLEEDLAGNTLQFHTWGTESLVKADIEFMKLPNATHNSQSSATEG